MRWWAGQALERLQRSLQGAAAVPQYGGIEDV
jgi:hypothetical protein